ncbi:MAG: hypothetical protein ABL904_07210 [Hyphomicrobiaceae bacterium]
MIDWWTNFGRESLMAGVIAGLLVALISLWHRWTAVKRGKPSPTRHGLLFVLDFIQTVSFFTLALTLSAMAAEKLIPKGLMWFLVLLIAIAMAAAVFLGQYAKDRIGPDDLTGTALPTTPEADKKST